MGLFKRRRSAKSGRFTSGPNNAESYDDVMLRRSQWRKEADRLLDLIEETKSTPAILGYLHSLYCHVSSRLRP